MEKHDRRKQIVDYNMYQPHHAKPGPMYMDYILIPIGYAYNRPIQKAKDGDRIAFIGGERAAIDTTVVIKAQSKICDMLCRMRYGVGIERVIEVWKNNASLEGYGRDAVSEDECMLITFFNEKKVVNVSDKDEIRP
jgi:hypothetical protein